MPLLWLLERPSAAKSFGIGDPPAFNLFDRDSRRGCGCVGPLEHLRGAGRKCSGAGDGFRRGVLRVV